MNEVKIHYVSKDLKPCLQSYVIGSAQGVYIPAHFALDFPEALNEKDRLELENPENEHYWDTWDRVLNNARIFDVEGNEYYLHHNEDLYLIRQGYGYNDNEDFVNFETNEIIEP